MERDLVERVVDPRHPYLLLPRLTNTIHASEDLDEKVEVDGDLHDYDPGCAILKVDGYGTKSGGEQHYLDIRCGVVKQINLLCSLFLVHVRSQSDDINAEHREEGVAMPESGKS